MAKLGGVYLNDEGKCRCGLFPNEHPEPQQLGTLIYSWMKSAELSYIVVFPYFIFYDRGWSKPDQSSVIYVI